VLKIAKTLQFDWTLSSPSFFEEKKFLNENKKNKILIASLSGISSYEDVKNFKDLGFFFVFIIILLFF
jgi:hypothetical protein